MIPIWQLMLGVCAGLVIYVLNRPQAITTGVEQREVSVLTEPGDNCSICLEEMRNDTMIYLTCGHAMHDQCFERYRSQGTKKCPICRQSL